jgi:hypothetical protein
VINGLTIEGLEEVDVNLELASTRLFQQFERSAAIHPPAFAQLVGGVAAEHARFFRTPAAIHLSISDIEGTGRLIDFGQNGTQRYLHFSFFFDAMIL